VVKPHGVVTLGMTGEDDSKAAHKYEVADCELAPKAAITSLGAVTERGRQVVLDDDPEVGNYIFNTGTKQKFYFNKVNGVYCKNVYFEAVSADPSNSKVFLVLKAEASGSPSAPPAEAGQDRRKIKTLSAPYTPTQREIDEHSASGHAQYRSWCPHCLRGSGRAQGHVVLEEDSMKPKLSIDYLFFGQKEDARPLTGLSFADSHTMRLAATLVPHKGAKKDVYGVQWRRKQVEDAGHSGIVFRSGQEPAILDLKRATIQLVTGVDIAPEESKIYDSASNGFIDVMNLVLENKVRTCKDELDRRFNRVFPSDHPIMSWLVPYCAVTYNLFHVTNSGKTPFEIARGRAFKGALPNFAESLHYKVIKKRTAEHRKLQLEQNWVDGMFVGVLERSLEVMVSTTEGKVEKALGLTRKVGEWWKPDLMDKLKATPWAQDPDKEEAGFLEGRAPMRMVETDIPRSAPVAVEAQPRRYYITDRIVQQFGATPNCEGCVKPNKPHNEVCRTRFMRLIGDDQEERDRYLNRNTIESRYAEAGIPVQGGLEPAAAAAAAAVPAAGTEVAQDLDMDDGGDAGTTTVIGPPPPPAMASTSAAPSSAQGAAPPGAPAGDIRMTGRRRTPTASTATATAPPQQRMKRTGEDAALPPRDGGPTDASGAAPVGALATVPTSEIPAHDRSLGFEHLPSVVDIEEAEMWTNYTFAGVEVNTLLQLSNEEKRYYDEDTGVELPRDLVHEADNLEISEYGRFKAYEEDYDANCIAHTGSKPIPARYRVTNKGDEDNYDVRARLVAQQVRKAGTEPIFTATPLWAMFCFLFSMLVTVNPEQGFNQLMRKLAILDLRRAFLHIDISRNVWVKPPRLRGTDRCWKLLKALYGTLTAADDYQRGFTLVLEDEIGFARGMSAPTCLHKGEEGLDTSSVDMVYHGDDIALLGLAGPVQHVISDLKKTFDVVVKAVLGFEPGDDKVGRLLNRILTIKDDIGALQVEADPRHAELIVSSLGLAKCKPVTTPGTKLDVAVIENSTPLEPTQATAYRGVAARARFLSEDRWDIGYSAKELCKGMASPTEVKLVQARRLGRHLKGRPRVVRMFRRQREPVKLVVHTDSDHIGCVVTRKGTCGYIAYHGLNALKGGSSTHSLPATSSAEDEYYGICKAGSEGLGLQSGCADLGSHYKLEILTDSTAARAVAKRQGIGRIRHLAVKLLWVQHYVRAGLLTVEKIAGDKNTGDILTKYLTRIILDKHMDASGLKVLEGRHPNAPLVQGDLTELSNQSILLLERLHG